MTLPSICDLAQRNTVRIIPTARLKPPILAALVDDDERLLADLAALESATNSRLQAQAWGRSDLDPRELVHGRAAASLINAAFIYTRPGGNRFNDEGRGAWYCAFEAETSVEEVAFHLTRELTAISRFETMVDYSELLADFIGPFHDLRSPPFSGQPYAESEAAIAYPAGQALARQLRRDADSNGVVYHSVRRPGGTCLTAFYPHLVQNVRQGGVWRLEWSGSANFTANYRND